MPIYVDQLFALESRDPEARRVGARNGHQWCHLWCDLGEEEALHALAAKIGMKSPRIRPRSRVTGGIWRLRHADSATAINLSKSSTLQRADATVAVENVAPALTERTGPTIRPTESAYSSALKSAIDVLGPPCSGRIVMVIRSVRAAESEPLSSWPLITSGEGVTSTAGRSEVWAAIGLMTGSTSRGILQAFASYATTATWRTGSTATVRIRIRALRSPHCRRALAAGAVEMSLRDWIRANRLRLPTE